MEELRLRERRDRGMERCSLRQNGGMVVERGGTGALLRLVLLLGEHADAEVSVLVRLEGGGHDEVLPRGHLEARADLAQVDEGL